MDHPPISAPDPYIEPTTPPAPAPTPPPEPQQPSFRISGQVQPGDVVVVTDIDYTWTFTFIEPIRISPLSPAPQVKGRPSRQFVTSDVKMTTTFQLANDRQPPRLLPEDYIVQGSVVSFGQWRAGHGGDMRTGTVVSLRHNGQQIF